MKLVIIYKGTEKEIREKNNKKSSSWQNLTIKNKLRSTAVEQVVACALVTQRARVRSRSGQVSWVRIFFTCKTNVRKL